VISANKPKPDVVPHAPQVNALHWQVRRRHHLLLWPLQEYRSQSAVAIARVYQPAIPFVRVDNADGVSHHRSIPVLPGAVPQHLTSHTNTLGSGVARSKMNVPVKSSCVVDFGVVGTVYTT